MRILVVADRLRRDGANGAEIFCGELCHRLARRHQLTLLLRGEPQPEPPPAAPSLVLGDGAAAGAAELAAALGGRLRWGDFDLLYNLGGLLFGSRVVHLLRLLGCDLPLVNHFQALLGEYARREGLGAAEQSAHAAVQRMVSAQAVLNVFPSQAECARAAELGFGGPACGVAVIPNGIAGADMAEVANAADVADVAGMRSVADVGNVADVVCVGNGAAVAGPPASPASPADDCGGDAGRRMVFVTAGRFSDRVKGADLVYRAFVRLYQERQDVFLLSVGNRPRFAEILGALPEVSHRVIEWLPRGRFMAVLAAADAVVLPSRYEPFGMIAVEAMRLGLPVVAPAVGGLREIVAHGETGLLTHLEDGSYGLYRAMARLAADPAAARAMGQAGRRRAADLYDIERVAASVDRALRLAVWEGAVRPLRTLLAGDPAAASW